MEEAMFNIEDAGILANAFWHASQIPQPTQSSQGEHPTVVEKRRAFQEAGNRLREAQGKIYPSHIRPMGQINIPDFQIERLDQIFVARSSRPAKKWLSE